VVANPKLALKAGRFSAENCHASCCLRPWFVCLLALQAALNLAVAGTADAGLITLADLECSSVEQLAGSLESESIPVELNRCAEVDSLRA